MTEHDFGPLFEHFPEVIDKMPQEFTSHQFILSLAQGHQPVYVEALFAYRDTRREGTPAPFLVVHGVLAQHLDSLPDLVVKVDHVPSTDIFGQSNECALWRKV